MEAWLAAQPRALHQSARCVRMRKLHARVHGSQHVVFMTADLATADLATAEGFVLHADRFPPTDV